MNWKIVRFALGMTQMALATVAVVLGQTGVSRWSLVAAVAVCVCTTISVLLFGGHRRENIQQDDRPARERRKAIR